MAQIREQQADFVIGLKDNPPPLAADMSQLLDAGCRTHFAELTTDVHTTTEQAHGGTEQREVRTSKIGAKNKRFKAALNPDDILNVLQDLQL